MRTKRRKSAKSKSKPSGKKIFLAMFGLASVSGVIYLAWEKYRKARDTANIDITNNFNTTEVLKSLSKKVKNDNFPLKKGSQGDRVRKIQESLVRILGAEVMGKNGGPDGNFGRGTEKALKQANLPMVIDEAAFNSITGGNGDLKIVFNPLEIAKALYYAARSNNTVEVLNQLRKIKNKEEYANVAAHYQKQGFIARTIVTDLLDVAFKSDEAIKTQLRAEFARMGLKNNAATAKWSLNGFRLFNDIVTIKDTYVEDRQKNIIPVKKDTILGDELGVSNGKTIFRALDNSTAFVPTRDIKYVE